MTKPVLGSIQKRTTLGPNSRSLGGGCGAGFSIGPEDSDLQKTGKSGSHDMWLVTMAAARGVAGPPPQNSTLYQNSALSIHVIDRAQIFWAQRLPHTRIDIHWITAGHH
jgi:hypothetical protein